MTYLLSDPRMSDREKACAEAWLRAAIDDEDPEAARYWQEQGLAARLARVAPGDEIAEPPAPEYKPSKEKPLPRPCPDCKSIKCKNSACLL
jgi:hypothetical protein